MTEPILPDHKGERITTGDLRVMCDGPHFSKHPRVYLTMVDDTAGKPSFVVCPYCSRVYEYDARLAMPGAGH